MQATNKLDFLKTITLINVWCRRIVAFHLRCADHRQQSPIVSGAAPHTEAAHSYSFCFQSLNKARITLNASLLESPLGTEQTLACAVNISSWKWNYSRGGAAQNVTQIEMKNIYKDFIITKCRHSRKLISFLFFIAQWKPFWDSHLDKSKQNGVKLRSQAEANGLKIAESWIKFHD